MRRAQRLPEPFVFVELRTGLLVEPLQGEFPTVDGSPVGHDEAAEPERALQHIIEQHGAATAVVAIDLVAGTHDCAGLATLDRELEREQVGLAMRGRIDDRVEPELVELVGVQRKMLQQRHHALGLRAEHRFRRHHAAQPRVFRQVLEVAPVPGITRQVHSSAAQHVEAFRASLATEQRARIAGERGIERGTQSEPRRQRRRRIAATAATRVGDAEPCIRDAQLRYAQPLHTGHPARDPRNRVGNTLVPHAARCRGDDGHEAADQGEPLVVRHSRFGVPRARIWGGNLGIGLRCPVCALRHGPSFKRESFGA